MSPKLREGKEKTCLKFLWYFQCSFDMKALKRPYKKANNMAMCDVNAHYNYQETEFRDSCEGVEKGEEGRRRKGRKEREMR